MANISKITYKGVTYDIYDASAIHSVTPYSLPVATYNTLGGVMPLYSNTGAVTGVTATSGSKTVAVNAISTTAGKYYAVEIDKDGRLYVNVPWTDDQGLVGAMVSDGYSISISGGTTNAKVPFFSSSTSTTGGMVKATIGDIGKYLRGDGTWVTPPDTHYTYWFYDSEANYGTVTQGAGNWTATFPKDSSLPATGFIKISGTNTSPAVGDLVITTGGFIGAVKSISGSGSTATVTVTFVGRMSFMAYNSPTAYDSATSTLILGSY